jgi:hypothetical protein
MSDEIPEICGECNKESENLLVITIFYAPDIPLGYICNACLPIRSQKLKDYRQTFEPSKEEKESLKDWLKATGQFETLNVLSRNEKPSDVV